MFTCGICGAKFNNLDEFEVHMNKCIQQKKNERDAEKLQKLNDDLNRVKQAKSYFEEQLAKFKEDHPEAYELNFGSKVKSTTSEKKNNSEKKVDEKNPNVSVKRIKSEDDFVKMLCDVLGV